MTAGDRKCRVSLWNFISLKPKGFGLKIKSSSFSKTHHTDGAVCRLPILSVQRLHCTDLDWKVRLFWGCCLYHKPASFLLLFGDWLSLWCVWWSKATHTLYHFSSSFRETCFLEALIVFGPFNLILTNMIELVLKLSSMSLCLYCHDLTDMWSCGKHVLLLIV